MSGDTAMPSVVGEILVRNQGRARVRSRLRAAAVPRGCSNDLLMAARGHSQHSEGRWLNEVNRLSPYATPSFGYGVYYARLTRATIAAVKRF